MSYNKTQLTVDKAFERHVFHRDFFAHYLRWSHLLNLLPARSELSLLDVGCGTGALLDVLYHNRYRLGFYLGLDVRKQTIEINKEKFKNITTPNDFQVYDMVNGELVLPNKRWDYITSFEVFEHIGKPNGEKFLTNIKMLMNEHTIFLMSTPCYDKSVGAADNHVIDGEVGEWGYNELKELLSKHFKIDAHYGTFASQRDYRQHLSPAAKEVYEQLHGYYDSNFLATVFAPMYPQYSRNCLWKLKLPS